MAGCETSEITGHLVSNIATRIFFQAAENISKSLDEGAQKGCANDEEEGDGEIYEVERILQDKFKRGKRLFLVRWKGYDETEDSWEPEENLEGAREVLNAYLANIENKKSTKKSKKKPFNSTKTPKISQEDSNSEGCNSSDSNDDFAPKKKQRVSDEKSKKSASGSQSIVDKAIARRKNLSNNMRWISESSDDTDDEQKNKVSVESSVDFDKQEPKKLAIHPDSSTDIALKHGLDSGNQLSAASTSLKLKISKLNRTDEASESNFVEPTCTSNCNNVKESDLHFRSKSSKEKSKKGKKLERELQDSVPINANTKSTLTFTGVFLDENKELRYVGVDDKTHKREVYALGEAFVADGWSLCRYLASKIKFASDGSVEISGDLPNSD